MNWLKSSNDPNGPISIGERICFSLGNVGLAIQVVLGGFLMFYYTNVVGLDAGIVGTIFLGARIFDGITDIIAGRIIDKTKSRWGKARLWVLVSAVPFGLAQFLLFCVPMDATARAQYIWVAATYVFQGAICYTMEGTAVFSLNSLITSNSKEQGILGVYFQCVANIAMMLMNQYSLKLVANWGDDAGAWSKLALIYGIIATVVCVICAFGTKERVNNDTVTQNNDYTLMESFMALIHDKRWVQFTLSYVIYYLGYIISASVIMYFVTYIVGDTMKYSLLSNSEMIIKFLLLTVFAPFLVKRLALSWCVAMLLMVVGAGIQFAGGSIWPVILVGACIRGLSTGATITVQGGLLAGVATHVREYSGLNITALSMASSTFAMKIASGVGSAIVGWCLDWSHFDGTLAVQPDSANMMIRILFTIVPIGTSLVCWFVLKGFTLDDGVKAKTEV